MYVCLNIHPNPRCFQHAAVVPDNENDFQEVVHLSATRTQSALSITGQMHSVSWSLNLLFCIILLYKHCSPRLEARKLVKIGALYILCTMDTL